jgi:hypothetical protein
VLQGQHGVGALQHLLKQRVHRGRNVELLKCLAGVAASFSMQSAMLSLPIIWRGRNASSAAAAGRPINCPFCGMWSQRTNDSSK